MDQAMKRFQRDRKSRMTMRKNKSPRAVLSNEEDRQCISPRIKSHQKTVLGLGTSSGWLRSINMT